MTDPVKLPVSAMVTGYRLCLLPEDNPDAETFALQVEWRGHDRWTVQHGPRCLNRDGEWDLVPAGQDRDEEWLTHHRFDLDDALERAEQLLPGLTVDGRTVYDLYPGQAGLAGPTNGGAC